MPNQFPLTAKSKLGYQPEQVDAFIEMARQQYEHPEGHMLTADRIRETEFDMVKGGYEVDKVDAALDRIEDALADHELARKRRIVRCLQRPVRRRPHRNPKGQ